MSVLDDVKRGALRTNITAFLKEKGWRLRFERFVFYSDHGNNLRATGDRGCPLLRCTRMVAPGYNLEFWVQPGLHDEAEEYEKWAVRSRGRGVVFVQAMELTEFIAWYVARWGWLDRSSALQELALCCPPIEEYDAG